MSTLDHGWILVQVADLMRSLEAHTDAGLRKLTDLDGELQSGAEVTVDRESLGQLRDAVGEVVQRAERAEQLLDALPADPILANYQTVADAAARDLAEGILDRETARLASTLLTWRQGWPALAESLRTTDVFHAWNDTTVADVLGAFRDVSPHLVRLIATRAALAPGTELSSCTTEQIAQLAGQLERHAGSR